MSFVGRKRSPLMRYGRGSGYVRDDHAFTRGMGAIAAIDAASPALRMASAQRAAAATGKDMLLARMTKIPGGVPTSVGPFVATGGGGGGGGVQVPVQRFGRGAAVTGLRTTVGPDVPISTPPPSGGDQSVGPTGGGASGAGTDTGTTTTTTTTTTGAGSGSSGGGGGGGGGYDPGPSSGGGSDAGPPPDDGGGAPDATPPAAPAPMSDSTKWLLGGAALLGAYLLFFRNRP